MNPKLFKIMISILVVLTIAGIIALVLVLNVSGKNNDGELTLDQMVEYSFTTSEMNTDLKDGSFVRIQFQIITDSEKAKKEIEKREFQLKNILIKESVTMTEADFKEGLTELEQNMKHDINQLMESGSVKEVYIISKILQ